VKHDDCGAIDAAFQAGLGLGVRCPGCVYKSKMMVARHRFEPGDTVLVVPDDACLTADTAQELAVTLAQELRLGKRSRWHQYLAFLPTELAGMPMFWNAKQRRMLHGTGCLERVQQQEAAAEMFDDGSTALSRALVSAYSFDLGPQDDPIPAMVPLFDALNHREGLCNVRLSHDPDREELSMIATKTVEVGAELINNYGKLGSSQLLRQYGFTELCAQKYVPRFVSAPHAPHNGDAAWWKQEGQDVVLNPYDACEVCIPASPPRVAQWTRIFASGLPEQGFPGTLSSLKALVSSRLRRLGRPPLPASAPDGDNSSEGRHTVGAGAGAGAGARTCASAGASGEGTETSLRAGESASVGPVRRPAVAELGTHSAGASTGDCLLRERYSFSFLTSHLFSTVDRPRNRGKCGKLHTRL